MSLHVALVTIPLAFGCVLLIDLSTPTNISSMPLLIIVMTSGFEFFPFSLLFSTLLDVSPSLVLVNPSPNVSLFDLGDYGNC